MKVAKFVERGQDLPRWYGYCYFDYCRLVYVCYPLGLNVLMSWAWSLLGALKSGPRSRFDKAVKEATRAEFRAGYEAGYRAARGDLPANSVTVPRSLEGIDLPTLSQTVFGTSPRSAK